MSLRPLRCCRQSLRWRGTTSSHILELSTTLDVFLTPLLTSTLLGAGHPLLFVLNFVFSPPALTFNRLLNGQRHPMKTFWIFLTLSIFYSAVAAPVAVEEIVKVRSNPEEVSKDGIGTWEKRMGPNDKGQSWTTDVQLPDGGTPGGVQGFDAQGVEEKGMSGLAYPWSTDDFGTGGWGPGEEASYNTPPKGPDGPPPEPPKSKLPSFLKYIPDDPTWYFRPRNFGSGDVGTPKRKPHGR